MTTCIRYSPFKAGSPRASKVRCWREIQFADIVNINMYGASEITCCCVIADAANSGCTCRAGRIQR